MRRSTLVFIFFGLIFAALVGANYVTTSQPPITLRLAVDPLAEVWVRQAAQSFSEQNVTVNGSTRVVVEVIRQTEAEAMAWTPTTHLDGWIAASRLFEPSFNPSQPFRLLAESLAETVLVWGGWRDYVDAVTFNNLPFDWEAVQDAAQAETWERFGMTGLRGYVRIGLAPTSSSVGYGALLSAIASYSQSGDLRLNVLGTKSFDDWFSPLKLAIGRPFARLIDTLATQGATRVNLALLSEAEWLTNLDLPGLQGRLVYAYPAYNVRLDFPFYLWDDTSTPQIQREGLRAFANFLRRDEQQQLLADYGLRRVGGQAEAGARLFRQGQALGLLADLPPMTFISPSDRAAIESVTRLLN